MKIRNTQSIQWGDTMDDILQALVSMPIQDPFNSITITHSIDDFGLDIVMERRVGSQIQKVVRKVKFSQHFPAHKPIQSPVQVCKYKGLNNDGKLQCKICGTELRIGSEFNDMCTACLYAD